MLERVLDQKRYAAISYFSVFDVNPLVHFTFNFVPLPGLGFSKFMENSSLACRFRLVTRRRRHPSGKR